MATTKEFHVETGHWSFSRPIAADIDGTDSEKKFFRRFRLLATDGLTNHVCNFTQFWNRLTPQISHQDEAVKHAVIALGAAYQIFQLSDHEQNHEKRTGKVLHTGSADEFTHKNLDVFTIQQYNKSICKLQRHVGSLSPESIQVTLICCLAFICLETMRGHPEAAPYSTVRDMQDIIDLFGCLEVSACFFASGLRPIVAERGYALRKYDDATSDKYPSGYYSPRQAHRPYTYFLRDVLARLYETSQEPPGCPFWSDPRQQRQQNCLRLRAARLDALIRQFLSGPYAPPPDTDDHYCIYLDLLHFRAAQILLAEMDERLAGHGSGFGIGYVSHLDYPSSPTGSSASSSYSSETTPRSFPTSPLPPDHATLGALLPQPDAQWLQSDLLNIVSLLNASHTANNMRHTSKHRIFFNDAGTVGPAYLVAVTATDPAIRSSAFRLLAETGGLGMGDMPGFFRDGPRLRQKLGLMVDPTLAGGLAGHILQ
ncbi:hypothetical protein GE09DRAFT_1232405 [Coniochaeta sp. 2T2.1]|nr:hypothetical protein GE09DRAFT_1232405 [Coniochaeta sp. 2T2.1]